VGSRPGWIITAIREGWTVRGGDALREPSPGSSANLSSPGAKREEQPIPAPTPEADPAAAEVWTSVLGDISAGDDESPEDIASTSLMMWFEGTVPLALENGVLTVLVPNSVAQEYIEMRFSGLLEASLKEHLSEGATLRLTTSLQQGS
jgi:hypothetical protein